MNYLEAEDHGHGPVPMEVDAMKGKKGDNGKGKYGKSFGKYDKNNEYSKNNEYGKGSEKGKEKGKEGKGKGQGKDEHQIRVSRATAGHVASGCTRRASVGKCYVEAVEEVPSSSASSVVPSAAPTAGGSSAWWVNRWHQSQEAQACGMSRCWTVDRCQRHVRMHAVRTSV